jgi:glucose-1-phosphate cytidylyltransferase
MKAIVLCGGMGTRLREQTGVRPKPMVEIGGRPILWHIMKIYAHYGVTDFILCLGYKGHMIKEYFLNYGALNSDFTVRLGHKNAIKYHNHATAEERWQVTLADTGENSPTGRRLQMAAHYLGADDKTFCLTYGDGVADVNLRKVLAFHRAHGKLATITGVRPPSRFGELMVEGARVVAFNEKPQVSEGLINGGFFVFEREFLRYLGDKSDCMLEHQPLERCVRDGQLQVFEHRGYWQCMDTYRDWERLEKQWQSGEAPWKVW